MKPINLPDGWNRFPGDGKTSNGEVQINGDGGRFECWVCIENGLPVSIAPAFHNKEFDETHCQTPEQLAKYRHSISFVNFKEACERHWGQSAYDILSVKFGHRSSVGLKAAGFGLAGAFLLSLFKDIANKQKQKRAAQQVKQEAKK